MKKTCVKIIAIFARLLMIIGLIGLVSSLSLPSGLIPDSFEMPLSGLEGLAVDSEGNIYCGVQYYSRFQVYNAQGKFLYGKCFNSGKGAFKIKINSNDDLEIMTYRGKRKYLFDKDGTLLSKSKYFSSYAVGFEQVDNFYCYDRKQKITYQIKPILLPSIILAHSTLIAPFGSHIVKIDSSGKETVIIKTPFYKWLFTGLFPAILFILIGGFVYSIIMGKKVKFLFWTINDDGRDIKSIDDMRVDKF